MPQIDLVRVTNHRPTLLHLPDRISIQRVKDADGSIHERMVGVGSGKQLIPGGNNVGKDEWEAAKGHHVVKQWLELGWLSEGGDTAKPEGPEPPRDLSGYQVQTATTMIEAEDSAETLAQWLKAETRNDVKAALQRRLEAVGAGGKPDDSFRRKKGIGT